MNSIAKKYRAELIATYASSFQRELWASVPGTAPAGTPSCFPKSSLAFPSSEDRQITLLSPRKKAEVLVGDELKAITKVLRKELQEEGVQGLPAMIWAKKYFRAVLSYGATAGTRRLPSDSGSAGRRNYVLGVCSTNRRRGADGTEEEFETVAYGAALHYAVLRIAGKTRAYAYMECVKSDADVSGRYGLTSQHRGVLSFRSFGGACQYVDVCALDCVAGTLQRGTRHYVLYPRIPFSLVES